METIVYSDLALKGALVMSKNEAEFPANPTLGTMIIKDYCLYAYIRVGGMDTWFPFSRATRSYVHVQGLASTTWTVNHNLGTTDVWFQVTDGSGNVLYVGKTDINENSFQLDFTSIATGRCVVVAPDSISVPQINASVLNVANNSVIIDSSGVLINGSYALTSASIAQQIADAIATKDNTDEITEGTTNLYFTNARARAAISVTDNGGDGSLSYNNTSGVISYTGPSASEVRAHFTSGTGIQISNGQISVDGSIATVSSLNAEITRASNAEATIAANVLVEKTRAMAAEASIAASISSYTPAFSSLTGTPTTIAGYGITDAYTKTQVDNAITNGAITSLPFSSITAKPTTLSGYGITDAQAYSLDLTNIATSTADNVQLGFLQKSYVSLPLANKKLSVNFDDGLTHQDNWNNGSMVGGSGVVTGEQYISSNKSLKIQRSSNYASQYTTFGTLSTNSAYTIEAWIYPTSGPASVDGSDGYLIGSSDIGGYQLCVSNAGSLWFNNATLSRTFTMNAWNHIAIVGNAGNTTVYVNGQSGYSSNNFAGTSFSTFKINDGGYTRSAGFYIDNVLITNTARYTTSFVPNTQTDYYLWTLSTPTTLAGYSITDAYTKTQVDSAISASLATLGNAFNYVGTVAGGASSGAALDMNTQPTGNKDPGDYYRVTTAGYFKIGAGGTPFYANTGDGLVWNTTGGIDKIDNTDPSVTGTNNEISVAGSIDTGFTISLHSTFSGRVSTAEANILTENTRALNAEATISANVLVEKTRAMNAEATISASVSTEMTRASNAEATISANVLVEKTRAMNAESTLSAAIAAETSRAQAAEASLATAVIDCGVY